MLDRGDNGQPSLESKQPYQLVEDSSGDISTHTLKMNQGGVPRDSGTLAIQKCRAVW